VCVSVLIRIYRVTSLPGRMQSIVMSVCLIACLSTVCLSTRIFQRLHVRTSSNFLYILPMALTSSSSGGVVMRCVLPVVYDVMFSHDGPMARRVPQHGRIAYRNNRNYCWEFYKECGILKNKIITVVSSMQKAGTGICARPACPCFSLLHTTVVVY